MSAIDIGQRYGVVVNIKPIEDLSVAVYYRPGLIVPFDFAKLSSADGDAYSLKWYNGYRKRCTCFGLIKYSGIYSEI